MAEARGPTLASNKIAMSRALGAAFLNHQVQQLEKTVSNTGPTHGNWRDRRAAPAHNELWQADQKRPRPTGKPKKRESEGVETEAEERSRRRDAGRAQKDADVIVVDASVLVHALAQVKKWCRDGRSEVIIVPLEALNTLDLLKKGTSVLAQRARAASRILEAQVGTNPRIKVQQDDAFVLWDTIPFQDTGIPSAPGTSPEWVRRTICCARWEVEHAGEKEKETEKEQPSTDKATAKPHVVLAVLSQAPDVHAESIHPAPAVSASPVPLPAPQTNRYEPRSAGTLVASWAARAGIEVLEVHPSTPPGHNAALPGGSPGKEGVHPSPGRRSAEEERGNGGRRGGPPGGFNASAGGGGGKGRRGSNGRTGPGRPGSGGGLVERPPAVMAMMEMVAQPSRVVRVLARGEKLDPDS